MKVVCFIHSCTLPMLKTEKLDELIKRIEDSGLLIQLDNVFINNIGIPIDTDRYKNPRITIINHSNNTDYFENSTLKMVYLYAQHNPDAKILYLHTKGVSYPKNAPPAAGINDWIEFMLYSLVDHHSECIKLLDSVEMVGVNYRNMLYYKWKSHFSGNYWWTKAEYYATLNMHKFNSKYDAEFEIMSNNPTFHNIHTCPKGHCENLYPPSEYKDSVQQNFLAIDKILSQRNQIYYGVEGNYADVTFSVIQKCIKGYYIHIPVSDKKRVELFGDPVPGKEKHIKIGDLIFPEKLSIRYPTTILL